MKEEIWCKFKYGIAKAIYGVEYTTKGVGLGKIELPISSISIYFRITPLYLSNHETMFWELFGKFFVISGCCARFMLDEISHERYEGGISIVMCIAIVPEGFITTDKFEDYVKSKFGNIDFSDIHKLIEDGTIKEIEYPQRERGDSNSNQ